MKSMSGISPKLPLIFSESDGPFSLNKTIKESVSQNLKNLLLTSPGEKVMDPSFGVGLHALLFENFESLTADTIKSKIIQQVNKYMPFIEVLQVMTSRDDPSSGQQDKVLKISVEFLIKPLEDTDILIINSDAN
jgi:phage baseplate assembly protein W